MLNLLSCHSESNLQRKALTEFLADKFKSNFHRDGIVCVNSIANRREESTTWRRLFV